MALQLIEVFQCNVTYSMKENKRVFLTVAILLLISLCVTAALELSYVHRSAKFYNFFAHLFILFYFRSENFRTSVNGKLK